MASRTSRALDSLATSLMPMFTAGDCALAVRTLVSACSACRRVRKGKNAITGSYEYENVPDTAIQIIAASKILEWGIGRPISRTITADISPEKKLGPDPAQHFSQILADPEMAASLQRQLAQMVAAAARRPIGPIEVTTEPSPDK